MPREYFPNPYISPQMELRHSSHAITSFHVPRYVNLEWFIATYHAARHEVETISSETSDGREYVDLDTPKAKMIIARDRRMR